MKVGMRASSTALLAAVAALAAPGAPVPAPAPKAAVTIDGITKRQVDNSCNCGTTARTERQRYWELHRPSTPQERAETGRLNREFLEASRIAAAASAPVPPPDPAQLAYEKQMKNYRALTESYQRRMREYNQLHAQAEVAQQNWQDAARADGYAARGNTGY